MRIVFTHAGMAGKDDVANAVLGGASDNIFDIGNVFMKMFTAPNDEERVSVLYIVLYFL